VSKNVVLRRIFGSKGDEIIGGWVKLHNVELHYLHTSTSTIRMSRYLAGRVACMEKFEAYEVLIGRPK
jgi:hypothetical protein